MSETVNEIIEEYVQFQADRTKELDSLPKLEAHKSSCQYAREREKMEFARISHLKEMCNFKYRLQKVILMSDMPLEKSLNMVNIMSILTLDDFIGLLKAHNMV